MPWRETLGRSRPIQVPAMAVLRPTTHLEEAAMDFTYDPAEGDDITVMRLLLNDVDEPTAVFSDDELQVFLTLEGGHVKLAAAQAIDTNADNEALASKVLRTQDLTTDGAKLATALRDRARALRAQHADDVDGIGAFDIISGAPARPEHTNYFGGF
jgi:hypothetical protein